MESNKINQIYVQQNSCAQNFDKIFDENKMQMQESNEKIKIEYNEQMSYLMQSQYQSESIASSIIELKANPENHQIMNDNDQQKLLKLCEMHQNLTSSNTLTLLQDSSSLFVVSQNEDVETHPAQQKQHKIQIKKKTLTKTQRLILNDSNKQQQNDQEQKNFKQKEMILNKEQLLMNRSVDQMKRFANCENSLLMDLQSQQFQNNIENQGKVEYLKQINRLNKNLINAQKSNENNSNDEINTNIENFQFYIEGNSNQQEIQDKLSGEAHYIEDLIQKNATKNGDQSLTVELSLLASDQKSNAHFTNSQSFIAYNHIKDQQSNSNNQKTLTKDMLLQNMNFNNFNNIIEQMQYLQQQNQILIEEKSQQENQINYLQRQIQNYKNNDKLLTLDDLKCDADLNQKIEKENNQMKNEDIVKQIEQKCESINQLVENLNQDYDIFETSQVSISGLSDNDSDLKQKEYKLFEEWKKEKQKEWDQEKQQFISKQKELTAQLSSLRSAFEKALLEKDKVQKQKEKLDDSQEVEKVLQPILEQITDETEGLLLQDLKQRWFKISLCSPEEVEEQKRQEQAQELQEVQINVRQ